VSLPLRAQTEMTPALFKILWAAGWMEPEPAGMAQCGGFGRFFFLRSCLLLSGGQYAQAAVNRGRDGVEFPVSSCQLKTAQEFSFCFFDLTFSGTGNWKLTTLSSQLQILIHMIFRDLFGELF
jgi:hypothetical protein